VLPARRPPARAALLGEGRRPHLVDEQLHSRALWRRVQVRWARSASSSTRAIQSSISGPCSA
jgi:hypothetical protein